MEQELPKNSSNSDGTRKANKTKIVCNRTDCKIDLYHYFTEAILVAW